LSSKQQIQPKICFKYYYETLFIVIPEIV